jgi:glutathione reductase (NADPH)
MNVQHCIDSDGFFQLEHLPKRVAIVGAGYIAGTRCGVRVLDALHTLRR